MKFDIQKRALSAYSRGLITEIVNRDPCTRARGAGFAESVDTMLARFPGRAGWDKKIARRRSVKHQARSLLLALESVRPELKNEVNRELTGIVLGMKFEQMLNSDYLGMLTASLRALVKGEAEATLSIGGKAVRWRARDQFTKEDFPSLNMMSALAHLWQKHTRFAVSCADGAPFVRFVSAVLTDIGATDCTDPRRLIRRVLETEPELRGKPKK